MAIEDSIVLAKCLRDVPDVDDALVRYEALRRERVERIVKHGRRNGTGKAPGAFGRVVRDLFMRRVFSWLERKGVAINAWIYEQALQWDTPCG